jgi:hypothetical protein
VADNTEDFDWGFSFSDADDNEQVVAAVSATSAQVTADLGPVLSKLDTLLALIPAEGIASASHEHPHTHDEVDLSGLENKLDTIIALERVDALTAGDMPDMGPILSKLDAIMAQDTEILDGLGNQEYEQEAVDFSPITDRLDTIEQTVGEVRELDFNGDGNVDFGDINNNLADLLARQDVVETELEAKKQEFEDFKAKKLKSIESLILPLLKNLKSNPTKAYIHWPNRTAVIDAQISKILSITR